MSLLFLFFSSFFFLLPFPSVFFPFIPPLLLFFFLFFAPCVSLNCRWWALCNQSVWILGNNKNQEFKPWEKLRELAGNKHFVTKHGSMSSAHWAPCNQSVWILEINKNQEFKPERNFGNLRIINTLSRKIESTKGRRSSSQRLKTDLGGNVGASDSRFGRGKRIGNKWLWIKTQIVQFIHIFLKK